MQCESTTASVIVEGYTPDQAGSTIQHIIDALENVVYDSDAWNTNKNKKKQKQNNKTQERKQTQHLILTADEDVDATSRRQKKNLRIENHACAGAGGQHVNKTESADPDHPTSKQTGIVVMMQDSRLDQPQKPRLRDEHPALAHS